MAAFAFTKTYETPVGSQRITGGTFTSSGGATGGDIITGLQTVNQVWLQHSGSGVVADEPVCNETFPVTSAVTIVTTADKAGYWAAIGV